MAQEQRGHRDRTAARTLGPLQGATPRLRRGDIERRLSDVCPVLCQGYGPQDASGEVSSSPPVRVEVVAAAVAAALLQTIPPTLQAAHLAEQLQVTHPEPPLTLPCRRVPATHHPPLVHPVPLHLTLASYRYLIPAPLTIPHPPPVPSPLTFSSLPSPLTALLQENEVRGSPLLCGLDDARLEPPFVFVVSSP